MKLPIGVTSLGGCTRRGRMRPRLECVVLGDLSGIQARVAGSAKPRAGDKGLFMDACAAYQVHSR